MWKIARMAVIVFAVVICSCGGGSDDGSDDGSNAGDSGDGSGSVSSGENTGATLTAESAATTSRAISMVAIDVTQELNDSSPAAMVAAEKALTELKDTGSFTRTVNGSVGGSCTLTGSGVSELDADPMTFSISGTLDCASYVTTVTTDSGNTQVTLNGTISSSMSGSIRQNYSSIETSFTMSWSNLSVNVGNESFSAVNGNYSISVIGSNGVLSVTESGTVGNQTVSQTYTRKFGTAASDDNPGNAAVFGGDSYTDGGSSGAAKTPVYDYFSDSWVVYKNLSLYLGDYQKDESVNPDTCSNNFFSSALSNSASVTGLTAYTLSFYSPAMSATFVYDADYPHFDGSDILEYWLIMANYVCAVSIGSLPYPSGYKDIIIMSCAGNGHVCGVNYTRNNTTTVKSLTKSNDNATDETIDEAIQEVTEKLFKEVKEVQ